VIVNSLKLCAVVDETRVLRLLRSIADDLDVLTGEESADDRRRSDLLWLRGVKYTFITAIEACVDVAQHVCAAEGWGPPQDNGDAMSLLGRHGVLPSELATSMRQAVRFRNVLVHEYVAVDDEVVIARLADPSDLRNFVRRLTEWLAND
jgi:uncharacterized protein YutE (UPF0331/DUF86 family)